MILTVLGTFFAAKGVEFDLTINLGNILTIFSFLGGGLFFIFSMQRRIDGQSQRMSNLEQDITQIAAETQNDVKNLTQVIVLQSRHDERITALQMTQINQGKRLDDTVRRMNTYLDLKRVDTLEDEVN